MTWLRLDLDLWTGSLGVREGRGAGEDDHGGGPGAELVLLVSPPLTSISYHYPAPGTGYLTPAPFSVLALSLLRPTGNVVSCFEPIVISLSVQARVAED